MHAFFIEDRCLLFSEPRQRIHGLNTSAAVIWCHLQDGLDAPAIEEKLRDGFGLSGPEAAGFVAAALADWHRLGFLAGSPADATPVAEPRPEAFGDLPPYGEPVAAAERRYTLLGTRLLIRFTALEQAAVVHPVLAHLEAVGAESDTVLDVVGTPGRLALYRDGEGCGACDTLDGLAPLVKGLVWATAVNRHDFLLGIHAGVVADGSGAMLLPGGPGSGKSTLVAALVHSGHQYFSDEMALLRDGDLHVVPVQFSLCVKDTGLDVLRPLFPELRDLPFHARGDGKRVAYLPPPGRRPPAAGASLPVRAVVLPRYVAGAASLCRALPKSEALRRLLDQCLVVRGPLDAGRVGVLVQWIRNVACFECVFGDLSEAAAIAGRILCQSQGGASEDGGGSQASKTAIQQDPRAGRESDTGQPRR